MASITARRPPRAAWSVEERARFAALREYELLQLLSRDKKALTTARRLGLSLSHPQPQPPSRSTAVGGGPVMPNAPAPAAALVSNGPNARQRRSAARSAQRHAARRAQMCSRSMLAIIFIVRLRRFVSGTLGFPSSDCIATSGFAFSSKRGSGERPSSGCSGSSEASSAASSLHHTSLCNTGGVSRRRGIGVG
jgi:hypothetical protein